ncbi:MAG: helix-turn-helix transcriptional regulator [Pseudomonadota bacterium]
MENLTRNLCEVVSRADSVADFCRRVGINRQQFNKYLAGAHLPSHRTMLKIAQVCGLDAGDFQLDPAAFLDRVEGRNARAAAAPAGSDPHFQALEGMARSSLNSLKPFLGSYFRYHHSSIFPGRVIRAVTVIFQASDVVRYVTVEHMPASDDNEACRFSYRGVCYLMGNRVFMGDYEHRQLNEMTSTILMPQFRTPIRYMFGLLTGIAANTYGQPFATRVAFERKSDTSVIHKAMVRQATMLLPGDPQIPGNVRRYLGNAEGAVLMGSE